MSDNNKMHDYPLERVGFGAIILGGYILAMGTLAFFPIPEGNLQLFAQGIGGLGAAVGIIVAAIWKTSMTERQQAQTLQTLAAASTAPLQTTVQTTVERTDGQGNSTFAASSDSRLDQVGSVRAGGAASDAVPAVEPDAAAAAYGTSGAR